MEKLTNGINTLKSLKKPVKKIKERSSNTRIAFSSVTLRKGKKDIGKRVTT